LSLQAHPTPEQARAGFAREEAEGIPIAAYDRNYRDAFHKPELIVAVSETFDALSGFRPLDEVAGILEVLREADAADAAPEPAALDLLAAHLDTADPLRDTVEWLLRDGRGGDTGEAAWVTERVTLLAASDAAGRSPFAPSFATVGALAEVYPGDPGIVISLLLNRVRLRRGEALYLAAGNIHAYLAGLGIELMAASDNVLRGGLTPKHIDVEELVSVLDPATGPAPVVQAVPVAPGVEQYVVPVADFALRVVRPAGASTEVPFEGVAIVLATAGELVVSAPGGEVVLRPGQAALATSDERALHVTGDGELFVATPGA
ncbi:MAG: mannose-6-phosphate isomerase, class I, partial [Microbacterium sp.]